MTGAAAKRASHGLGWSPEVLADLGVAVIIQADELVPTALRLVGNAS